MRTIKCGDNALVLKHISYLERNFRATGEIGRYEYEIIAHMDSGECVTLAVVSYKHNRDIIFNYYCDMIEGKFVKVTLKYIYYSVKSIIMKLKHKDYYDWKENCPHY